MDEWDFKDFCDFMDESEIIPKIRTRFDLESWIRAWIEDRELLSDRDLINQFSDMISREWMDMMIDN